jgi:hypothetical protein
MQAVARAKVVHADSRAGAGPAARAPPPTGNGSPEWTAHYIWYGALLASSQRAALRCVRAVQGMGRDSHSAHAPMRVLLRCSSAMPAFSAVFICSSLHGCGAAAVVVGAHVPAPT